MKKILPILIALLGLGGGVAAGTIMKPAEQARLHMAEGDDGHGKKKASADGHGTKDSHGEASDGSDDELVYVGLDKPFFVPVIKYGQTNTLVRLDIHLEVPEAMQKKVKKHDPKLRDAFLRTVMNFSYDGGFSRVHGGEGFSILRDDLLISAREILGASVQTVLIGEILTRES